jgi:hypothetical protein
MTLRAPTGIGVQIQWLGTARPRARAWNPDFENRTS